MSHQISIPKNLLDSLITQHGIEQLKASIRAIALTTDGESLRTEIIIFGAEVGFPLLPFFSDQLDRLEQISIKKMYFERIKTEVLDLLAIILVLVQRERKEFENKVVETKLATDRAEAESSMSQR